MAAKEGGSRPGSGRPRSPGGQAWPHPPVPGPASTSPAGGEPRGPVTLCEPRQSLSRRQTARGPWLAPGRPAGHADSQSHRPPRPNADDAGTLSTARGQHGLPREPHCAAWRQQRGGAGTRAQATAVPWLGSAGRPPAGRTAGCAAPAAASAPPCGSSPAAGAAPAPAASPASAGCGATRGPAASARACAASPRASAPSPAPPAPSASCAKHGGVRRAPGAAWEAAPAARPATGGGAVSRAHAC